MKVKSGWSHFRNVAFPSDDVEKRRSQKSQGAASSLCRLARLISAREQSHNMTIPAALLEIHTKQNA